MFLKIIYFAVFKHTGKLLFTSGTALAQTKVSFLKAISFI